MKKGFTLAEMLIAISIVGTITAICVTPVIFSTQNKEYSLQTKKAITTLQDAIDLKLANYGWPSDAASITIFQWLTRENEFERASIVPIESNTNNFMTTKNDITYFRYSSDTGEWFNVSYCLKRTNSSTNRCQICMDINGSDGPTVINASTNLSELQNKARNDESARDIVCTIIKDGIVLTTDRDSGWCDATAACNRRVQYLSTEE